jgi:hypothetical protein
MGCRAAKQPSRIQDVKVPKENVVGSLTGPTPYSTPWWFPNGWAPLPLTSKGSPPTALDVATSYTTRRKAFSNASSRSQLPVAEAAMLLDASARWFTTARAVDAGSSRT